MTEYEDYTELGPCCACEKIGPTVRNIVMIAKKGVIAGHGWGCVVCGLPGDGASYVLCDACFKAKREPIYACRGYPATEGRILLSVLTVPFDHDESKHTELANTELSSDVGVHHEEEIQPGVMQRVHDLAKEFADRFSDISPPEGTEECICSNCGQMIGRDEDDSVWDDHDEDCIGCDVCEIAIRIFRGNQELRFCMRCFRSK
jgi:hypothetical protein